MPLLEWLGNPTRDRLVVLGMLALVVVFTVKTLFLSFLAWRQMHFVYCRAVRTFASHVRRLPASAVHVSPRQRNSAQLIRNAVSDSTIFTQTGLMAGIQLLTELMVVIGVSLLLLAVEPAGAIVVVSLLGAAAWGFYRLTNNRILRWGEARQLHEGLAFSISSRVSVARKT